MSGLLNNCVEKLIAACIGAGIIHVVIGDWTPILRVLAILVVADTISGLAVAWRANKIKSAALKDGALKLLIYACLIAVFYQLGTVVESLQFARDAVAVYLALTEGVSVVENAANLGVKIPPGVLSLLRLELSKHEKPADPPS